MSVSINPEAWSFKMPDGKDYLLQWQNTIFSTEIELFQMEQNGWVYVFDENSKRRPIYLGPALGIPGENLPFKNGPGKGTPEQMIESWGGPQGFVKDFVIPEVNKRLKRLEGGGAVPGTVADTIVLFLKTRLVTSGWKLIWKG